MPARFTTKHATTDAFNEMRRSTFDNTSNTRKVVAKVGEFATNALRSSGQFVEDPRSSLEVIVHLELKDYASAKDGTNYAPLTVLLSIGTLCVFPMLSSAEDKFEVEYRYENRTLERFRYRYGRSGTLSWLVIPFNILVSSWHPNYSASADAIEMQRVLPGLRQKIQNDAAEMRARVEALRQKNQSEQQPGPQTEPPSPNKEDENLSPPI